MKRILATPDFTVKKTGRNYDFIAVIGNNGPQPVKIRFTGDYADLPEIEIPGNDWIGILADEEGAATLEALEADAWTASEE